MEDNTNLKDQNQTEENLQDESTQTAVTDPPVTDPPVEETPKPKIDPFVSFIRQQAAATGKDISNKDVLALYKQNVNNKADYIAKSYADAGKTLSITQAREMGRRLGIPQEDFDGIDNVRYDDTIDSKIVDHVKKRGEEKGALNFKGGTTEDLENAVAAQRKKITGASGGFGSLYGGQVRVGENEEEEISDRLVKEWEEDQVKDQQYKKVLEEKNLPIVRYDDLFKKYSQDENNPTTVRNNANSHMNRYITAMSDRTKVLADKVTDRQEKELMGLLIAREEIDGFDVNKQSPEFQRWFDSSGKTASQIYEFKQFNSSLVEDDDGNITSYQDDLNEFVRKNQKEVDKRGLGAYLFADQKGQSSMASLVVGAAINSFNSTFTIADRDFNDDLEELQNKKYSRDEVQGLMKKIGERNYKRDLRSALMSASPSNFTGPSAYDFIPVPVASGGTVNVRFDSKDKAVDIFTDNKKIIPKEDWTKEQQEAFNKAQTDPSLRKQRGYNLRPIGKGVVEASAGMVPLIAATYMTGGLATAAGATTLGVQAVSGSTAALVTYAQTYGDNYKSHLAQGFGDKEARAYARRISGVEAFIGAAVGPIERKFGTIRANQTRRALGEAAQEAHSVAARAAVGQATANVAESTYQKAFWSSAKKKLGQYAKDGAGEVLEELFVLNDTAAHNASLGRTDSDVTADDIFTTAAVSFLTGASFSTMSNPGVSIEDLDNSILHIGRHYNQFEKNKSITGIQLGETEAENTAKEEMLVRSREGYVISDKHAKRTGILLSGENMQEVNDLILESAKTPDADTDYDAEIGAIYDRALEESADAEPVTDTDDDGPGGDDGGSDDDDTGGPDDPDAAPTPDTLVDDLFDDPAAVTVDNPDDLVEVGGEADTDVEIDPEADAEVEPVSTRPQTIADIETVSDILAEEGRGSNSFSFQDENGNTKTFARDEDGDFINLENGETASDTDLENLRDSMLADNDVEIDYDLEGNVSSNEGAYVRYGNNSGYIVEHDGNHYVETLDGDLQLIESGSSETSASELGITGIQGASTRTADIGRAKSKVKNTVNGVVGVFEGDGSKGTVEIGGQNYDFVKGKYDPTTKSAVVTVTRNGKKTNVKGEDALSILQDQAAHKLGKSRKNITADDVKRTASEINKEPGISEPKPRGKVGTRKVQQSGSDRDNAGNDGTESGAEPGRDGDTGATDTDNEPGADGEGTGTTNAADVNSGAADGSAKQSGDTRPAGEGSTSEPTRPSSSRKGHGFTKSEPYRAINGKSYYYEGGKWRGATSGRALSDAKSAELTAEIGKRIISQATLHLNSQNIFAGSQIITDFLNSEITVGEDIIEQFIKEQNPELYKMLLGYRDHIRESGVKIVGYDNTADFQAATGQANPNPDITANTNVNSDTSTDVNIISTPSAEIISELQKLGTVEEKLNWLKDKGLLEPMVVNGQEFNGAEWESRKIVMMKIGNVSIPFYISTGKGGKKDVAKHKWYPVFGIGQEGWLNKGSTAEINEYYKSPVFAKFAKILNEGVGNADFRGDNDTGRIKDGIAFIEDTNFAPVNDAMNIESTPAKSNKDVQGFYDHASNVLNAVTDELKAIELSQSQKAQTANNIASRTEGDRDAGLSLGFTDANNPNAEGDVFESKVEDSDPSNPANQLSFFDENGDPIVFAAESKGEPYVDPDLVPDEQRVQTQWNESKNIQFTGTTKVKDASDVAHIFRLLENKAVEQAYVVHVDSEGNSHIQHMSMGGVAGTVVDPKLIVAGVSKFKSEKVYLIHNHPSGNLEPSQADFNITAKVRNGLRPLGIPVEHVIMDTYKQEYTVIDQNNEASFEKRSKKDYSDVPLQTFTMDEQSVDPTVLGQKISASNDVAKFFQNNRFTARPKGGVLILDRKNTIVGHFAHPDGISDLKPLLDQMAAVNGSGIITYGNTRRYQRITAPNMQKTFDDLDYKYLDDVTFKSEGSDIEGYLSAAEEGLSLNEQHEKYGTDPISNSEVNEPSDSPQQKDVRAQIDEKRKELESAKKAYSKKAREIHEHLIADQKDLFGQRDSVLKAQTGLFEVQRIDADPQDILAPLKANIERIRKEINSLSRSLEAPQTGSLFESKVPEDNNLDVPFSRPLINSLLANLRSKNEDVAAEIFEAIRDKRASDTGEFAMDEYVDSIEDLTFKNVVDILRATTEQDIFNTRDAINYLNKIGDPNIGRILKETVKLSGDSIFESKPQPEITPIEVLDDSHIDAFNETGLVPNNIISTIANKIKNKQQLSNNEMEIYNAAPLLVEAELYDPLGQSESPKSAVYKDGKIHIDFSNFSNSDVSQAMIDSFMDKNRGNIEEALESRLKKSPLFKDYFDVATGERVDTTEADSEADFYSPDAEDGENGEVGTNISERYDQAEKIYGNEEAVKLVNGQRVKGRFVLAPFDSITPSHNPNTFEKSEGFPTENGVTVNDRDYESDKNAQKAVKEFSKDYTDAAFTGGNIIVSKDGIVMSGNNRTMSGQLADSDAMSDYYKILPIKLKQAGIEVPDGVDLQDGKYGLWIEWDAPNPVYSVNEFAKFNEDPTKAKSTVDTFRTTKSKLTTDSVNGLLSVVPDNRFPETYYAKGEKAKQFADWVVSNGIYPKLRVSEIYDAKNKELTFRGSMLAQLVSVGLLIDDSTTQLFDKKRMSPYLDRLSQMGKVFNSLLGTDLDMSDNINGALKLLNDYGQNNGGEKSFLRWARGLGIGTDGGGIQNNPMDVAIAYMLSGESKSSNMRKDFGKRISVAKDADSQAGIGLEGTDSRSKFDLVQKSLEVLSRDNSLQPSVRQELAFLASQDFSEDSKFRATEKGGIFESKVNLTPIQRIYQDVLAGGQPKIIEALETGVEKAIKSISPGVYQSMIDAGLTNADILKAVASGDQLVVNKKSKILDKISQMSADGLMKVSAADLFQAKQADFTDNGITLSDVKGAIGEVESGNEIPASLMTEAGIDVLPFDDNVKSVSSYLENRGFPKPIAKLAEEIYRTYPSGTGDIKTAAKSAMAIVNPMRSAMNLSTYYPFTDLQKGYIKQEFEIESDNDFNDVVRALFDDYMDGKSHPVMDMVGTWVKAAYQNAIDIGVPMKGRNADIIQALNLKEGNVFTTGDSIVLDNKGYFIEGVDKVNGQRFYNLIDVASKRSLRLSEAEVEERGVKEKYKLDPKRQKVIDLVTDVLKDIVPNLSITYFTSDQYRAHRGYNANAFMNTAKGWLALNMELATTQSIRHEAGHFVIQDHFKTNPEALIDMHKVVVGVLENGTAREKALARQVQAHVDQYGATQAKLAGTSIERVKAEEYLVELAALLADNKEQISKKNWAEIIDNIVDYVKKLFKTDFDFDIADADEAIDFINGVATRLGGSPPVNVATPVSQNPVQGLFESKFDELFTKGEKVTVYYPAVDRAGLETTSGRVYMEAEVGGIFDDSKTGQRLVKIGKNYYPRTAFSRDAQGRVVINTYDAEITGPSTLNADDTAKVDEIIKIYLNHNPDMTGKEIYDAQRSKAFKRLGVKKGYVQERFDLITKDEAGRKAELGFQKSEQDRLKNKNINNTLKRAIQLLSADFRALAEAEGVILENDNAETDYVNQKIADLLDEHANTPESIEAFYREFRKHQPTILGSNEVFDGKDGVKDQMDPRIFVGTMYRLIAAYGSFKDTLMTGLLDDIHVAMVADLTKLSSNSGLMLLGHTEKYSGLPSNVKMDEILRDIDYAITKELNNKKIGNSKSAQKEIDALTNKLKVTDKDISDVVDALDKTGFFKDLSDAVTPDDLGLSDLIAKADREINDDGTNNSDLDNDAENEFIFESKAVDPSKKLRRIVNIAFNDAYFNKRKKAGNSDFLRGKDPMVRIKKALETYFIQKMQGGLFGSANNNNKADIKEFYRQYPSVAKQIEKQYLKMQKQIATDIINTKGNADLKSILQRSYKSVNKTSKVVPIDKLLADSKNTGRVVRDALDRLRLKMSYAKDPVVRARILDAIQKLEQVKANLVYDESKIDINNPKFSRSINKSLRSLTKQDLAELGIKVGQDIDPQKYPQIIMRAIMNQSKRDSNLSITSLTQKLVGSFDMDPRLAVELAKAINDAYKAKVIKRKRAQLDRHLSKLKKGDKKNKSLHDRLVAYIEEGYLNEEATRKAVAAKFGFKGIDNKTRERLGTLLDLMESPDPRVVSRANREFRALINNLKSNRVNRILKALTKYRYISLLSGFGTALVSLISSGNLVIGRRISDNIKIAKRGKEAIKAFRRAKSKDAQLYGSILNRSGAAVQLARQALKEGSLIINHEDNPTDAISNIDKRVNEILLRGMARIGTAESKARAEQLLAESGSTRGEGAVEFGRDVFSTAMLVIPTMMTRTLQAMDVLFNTRAIERSAFLLAWDKTLGVNPDTGSEAFFHELSTNMGTGVVLDENNFETTFDEQLNSKVAEIEAANGGIKMRPGEKSILAKELVLQNRKRIELLTRDQRVELATDEDGVFNKDLFDVLERNKKTVNNISSQRALDASLLNTDIRGLMTGMLGYGLTMPSRSLNQAANEDSTKSISRALLQIPMSMIFPIVKVVVNNYYNSYAHNPMSIVPRLALKAILGVDDVRRSTRTGDLTINGIAFKDLKALADTEGGDVLRLLRNKDSQVRKAVEIMQEDKVSKEDYFIGLGMSTIGGVLAILAAFEWEEDEEGNTKIKKRESFWNKLQITAGGTGDYWENKDIFGKERKDNTISVGGFHTRWTEMPSSATWGMLGVIGDKLDLNHLEDDGTPYGTSGLIKDALYGTYAEFLGEGFGISTNLIGQVVNSGFKISEYEGNIKDARLEYSKVLQDGKATDREKRTAEVKLNRAVETNEKLIDRERSKQGVFIGRTVSSQFFPPNVYRQSYKMIKGGQEAPKKNLRTGSNLNDVLGEGRTASIFNSIVNNIPLVDATLENRVDMYGNPIPENFDLILAPDRWEDHIGSYIKNVERDPDMDFMINELPIDYNDIKMSKSAARRTKNFEYYPREAQKELDDIWHEQFGIEVKKQIPQLRQMSEDQQLAWVKSIAKRVKVTEEYRAAKERLKKEIPEK